MAFDIPEIPVCVLAGLMLCTGVTSTAWSQTTCQNSGRSTACTNGQTLQTFGNRPLDPGAPASNPFVPPPMPGARPESRTLDGQGRAFQTFGNRTYGPDGQLCQNRGRTMVCN